MSVIFLSLPSSKKHVPFLQPCRSHSFSPPEPRVIIRSPQVLMVPRSSALPEPTRPCRNQIRTTTGLRSSNTDPNSRPPSKKYGFVKPTRQKVLFWGRVNCGIFESRDKYFAFKSQTMLLRHTSNSHDHFNALAVIIRADRQNMLPKCFAMGQKCFQPSYVAFIWSTQNHK